MCKFREVRNLSDMGDLQVFITTNILKQNVKFTTFEINDEIMHRLDLVDTSMLPTDFTRSVPSMVSDTLRALSDSCLITSGNSTFIPV